MSPLTSRDSSLSKNSVSASPADAFDSQTAKAGIQKFAALWPLLPPVALFGMAFALMGAPLPAPIGNHRSSASTSIISASEWVVPASETLVVSKQAAAGYAVLRGRLRAPQGEAISAPSRGQVARVMARIGQVVKAGDPLLLISRGTIDAPRSTSPLERWSAQAEDAQIAAARQQENLEGRIRGANQRLEAAQARVSDAQARVADARALIKRLQNGEEVGREESGREETETPAAPAPTRQPENSNRNNANQNKAREDAARESQRLQKIADAADAKAKAAAKAAKAADGAVGEKQSQLKSAIEALAAAKSSVKAAPAKTPATAEAGNEATAETMRPSTPDTSQETKAVANARDGLATATSRASQAHREAAKLQSRAAELRGNANDAARRAMETLQVFENENDAAPTKIVKNDSPRDKTKSGGEKITIADAARIARQAMKESDEAIADADRIWREVKSYENPVSGTRRRVDDATRRLETAQQQIWNTAGASRPNITQVGAASSGTVLSISSITSEVNFGQTVAVIGRPDRLEVSIQDKSGTWKSLTVGARVLALVKTNSQNPANATLTPTINSTDKSTPALARPTSAQPISNVAPTLNGMPTLARVIAIEPPLKAGAPATVRIAIHNPPQSGSANLNGTSPRAFSPGMGVLLSVARPGKGVMIRVPAASIRRDENGKTTVAVLSPLPDADVSQPASACRVEWREVRVGAGDGFNNQILTGLQAGERLALRPDALYNFTLAHGADATVRVEQT